MKVKGATGCGGGRWGLADESGSRQRRCLGPRCGTCVVCHASSVESPAPARVGWNKRWRRGAGCKWGLTKGCADAHAGSRPDQREDQNGADGPPDVWFDGFGGNVRAGSVWVSPDASLGGHRAAGHRCKGVVGWGCRAAATGMTSASQESARACTCSRMHEPAPLSPHTPPQQRAKAQPFAGNSWGGCVQQAVSNLLIGTDLW